MKHNSMKVYEEVKEYLYAFWTLTVDGVNGQLVAPVALLQYKSYRYLSDQKEAGWLPQPVWVLQSSEHVSTAGNRTTISRAFSHCVD